jgi:hypothetical protein
MSDRAADVHSMWGTRPGQGKGSKIPTGNRLNKRQVTGVWVQRGPLDISVGQVGGFIFCRAGFQLSGYMHVDEDGLFSSYVMDPQLPMLNIGPSCSISSTLSPPCYFDVNPRHYMFLSFVVLGLNTGLTFASQGNTLSREPLPQPFWLLVFFR